MLKEHIIYSIFDSLNVDYFIFSKKKYSIVIFIFPYSDFSKITSDHAAIDPYYFESHRSYNLVKNLITKINEQGIHANIENRINLKKLFSENKITSTGINTLIYFQEIGSRFVMQAMKIDENIGPNVLAVRQTPGKLNQMNCDRCMRCNSDCPTQAIGSDAHSFKMNKCIRFVQESIYDDVISGAVDPDVNRYKVHTNKLMGCNLCQKICPYNFHSLRATTEPDGEIMQVLELSNILKICNNTSEIKKVFTNYIGSNYSRKKFFYLNAIICASNSRNKDYIPQLEALLSSENNHNIRRFIKSAISSLEI